MNDSKADKAIPGSFAPWSRIPSLQEMTEDAGIDFEEFIASLENDQSVSEMAEKFASSEFTITQLREHFYKYGVGSVMGGD